MAVVCVGQALVGPTARPRLHLPPARGGRPLGSALLALLRNDPSYLDPSSCRDIGRALDIEDQPFFSDPLHFQGP
jgi:hypothetical protein